MSSSIKLTNANGKILTITNPDSLTGDSHMNPTTTAYTIETVDDFGSVPSGYTTVIVKDSNRGGTFTWSSTGTANGGTVFAGLTGYWNRQYSGAVNVKWFGAVGDGIVDDTFAIQNAIDTLNYECGGTLIFDGQYSLGTNIGMTATKFNITTNDITLLFRSGTKFTIRSDNDLAIIFMLSGVSNIFMEGVLHIEGASTTTYSTTGIYGPRAVDIRNSSGGECGNIHIESIKLTRGAAAVVISSDYTSDNRINGVTIWDIYTEDVTYGINCAQNGDNVNCTTLTTKNAYRSWFAYGCRGHSGAIRSYSHHTGGTPINLSRYSSAEGGSNTNTEGFDLSLDVIDADTYVTCTTLRHLGDGGVNAKIRDINIRISANVLNTGLTALSLLNYTSVGGSTTATAFAAGIENVSITANIPDTVNTIYRDVCTWSTKPSILFDGTLSVSADTQLVLSTYLNLVVPVAGSWTAFTPTLVGTTTAGAGTYTTQSGSYCRIGKTIFFTISLSWSAHTGTGNMRLSGLPYASSGTATTRTYTVWTNNIALTAGNIATSVHGAGTTNITLQQMPTGGGGITSIPMDTSGDIAISGFYPI